MNEQAKVSKSASSYINPEPPLPSEANVKRHGDPLSMDIWTSGVEARKQEIVRLLSTPMEELAKALPEAEQQRYRDAQQSIVEARAYAEAHAHEYGIWR